MTTLTGKIDFMIILAVTAANPNGDPLAGNRPRSTAENLGEISDVCLKRKIRNRLQDMGEEIFVQSEDRANDGFKTLKERANSVEKLKSGKLNKDEYARTACDKWIDVRSFGQVFAFKSKNEKDSGVSVGVRGPVTISRAVSCSPITIQDMQITKSVSSEIKEGKTRGSDTMGHKHSVDFGLYTAKGSMNCQLAEKTGFTDEDAAKIKKALLTLFENDESSARPSGSMEVCKLIWWEHGAKTPAVSSAKVFRSVEIKEKTDNPKNIFDYDITVENIDGCVTPEVIDLV